MKKLLKFTAAIFLMLLVGLVIWSAVPNESAPFSPDPAVAYANQNFSDEQPYSEGYFEHEDVTLHYVEAGSGPLVVLVHGFPAYWYAMIRQMEALKPHFRVVAIDALGAGRSDAPKSKEAYQLDVTTAHLAALIVKFSPDQKVHLIGHDWGGAMVFSFAQKYPEHVASVVGISAPPSNVFLELLKSNSAQREESRYVEKMQRVNPAMLLAVNAPKKIWQGAYRPLLEMQAISNEESELFQNAFRNPKRINAYLNWYRANIPSFDQINDEHYWPSRDASLHMPSLVIRGKQDKVFVAEYVNRIRESSEAVQVLEIEDAGHWPHVEKAGLVNKRILEFLTSLTKP